ncbi:IclR family transcriptional regulator [Halobacteria archaeon AArc-curdl1]|uniref:IclR family transcriptional regulator n=1 Tax=Natronosalvus hydrolyticus TaxID=2979988 RepID=A0AAP2Z6E3_9EURY|nr:IclR family transcriptional regulator [Halobacteria archaeon AArc-curdl1]
METAKNPVRSVETTIEILDALKRLDGADLSVLADHLDLTKGTVHNHLCTLIEHGFVVRNDDHFDLGIRFFEFGEHIVNKKKVYKTAVPEVDNLSDETGELASLLIEEHGQGIYLHRAEGKQALTLDTRRGARVHLHQTALGKAILANLPKERVDEIIDYYQLPKATENTLTSRDQLFSELEDIREQGYAFDREERSKGIRCIAAPVITNDGTVHGAVSVAGPTSRMKGDYYEKTLPELVVNAANVISINTTYS